MSYLIMQILFCLIVAALIGFFIGWLLGRMQLGRWRTAYEELEVDHNERRADLEDMRSSLAAKTSGLERATTDLHIAEEKAGNLEADVEARRATITSLEARLKAKDAELEGLRKVEADLAERDKTVTGLNAQIRKLESEKDAELTRLQAELEKRSGDEKRLLELQTQATKLQNDLAGRDKSVQDLTTRLSAAETEKSSGDEVRMLELQSQAATLQDTVKARDERIKELESSLGDATSHSSNVETLTNQLANLQRNYSAQLERVAELEKELSAAQSGSATKGDSAAKGSQDEALRSQITTLQTDLKTREGRISELEAELAKGRSGSGDVASLTSQLSSLRADLDTRSSRISALEGELNDPERAMSVLGNRYTLQAPSLQMRFLGNRVRLRGTLPETSKRDLVPQLENALGEGRLIDELRSSDVVSVPKWLPDALRVTPDIADDLPDGSLSVRSDGVVLSGLVAESAQRERIERAVRQRLGDDLRIDNRLKVVGDDIEADDLKDIKGIETVLEPIMHSIGVYTFRQIANWTPEDIEQVRDSLQQFKTRIEREDWIGQSKELHKEKYGDDPTEL